MKQTTIAAIMLLICITTVFAYGGGGGGTIAATNNLYNNPALKAKNPGISELNIIPIIKAGEEKTVKLQNILTNMMSITVVSTKTTSSIGVMTTLLTTKKEIPGSTTFASYEILTNLKSQELSQFRMRFRIPTAWFEKNQIDPTSLVMYHHKEDGSLEQLPIKKESDPNTRFSYFTTTTPSLSIFTIGTKTEIQPTIVTPSMQTADSSSEAIIEIVPEEVPEPIVEETEPVVEEKNTNTLTILVVIMLAVGLILIVTVVVLSKKKE